MAETNMQQHQLCQDALYPCTQEEERAPQTDYANRAAGQKGVLEGLTPSSAWDTECTPHAEILGEPLIQIEQRSNKIITLVDGHPTPETNIAKLEHRVQEPVLGGLLRFEKPFFEK